VWEILRLDSGSVPRNLLFAFAFPFLPVLFCKIQTFITCSAKNFTFLQFFGKWNYVVVKKPAHKKRNEAVEQESHRSVNVINHCKKAVGSVVLSDKDPKHRN
jgi:hypothetical protein